ncbi:MAG TPA: hypothetical protein VFK80_00670, partial [Limnochordia bacterium]|nr:hypothetical protein [Limnochordia bacterium]
PVAAPVTLITVHLLTIGWLTLLILGALFQFVPVITEGEWHGDRAGLLALIGIAAGLLTMSAGFAGLGADSPLERLLPAGGVLVVAGVLCGVFALARVLWAARPWPLQARFVATALLFLLATVGLGVCFAFALATKGLIGAGTTAWLVTGGLKLHLAAGIGGWFTLTAMGVGYKLLPMFSLAPEERGKTGEAIYWLTAGGLALLCLAGFAGGAQRGLWWLGALAAGCGLVLYLIDMARLFRDRRRRVLELNARFAIWALAGLGAALALTAWSAATGDAGRVPTVVYLDLFAWLSGLSLSQLYKIVPFLTWLERYGPRLGAGRVPRVQDLVVEKRAFPAFVAYYAGCALSAAGGLLTQPRLWQAGALVTLLATLKIGRELWRARHDEPETTN